MSMNLNHKKVNNVTRRTWDVAAYESRAKERIKNEESGSNRKPSSTSASVVDDDDDAHREEFVPAVPTAMKAHRSDRAYLKARSNKVDTLDSKIGSVEIINPDAASTVRANVGKGAIDKDKAVTKSGVGWHCKVCDCFLRDSHTYLDHINGRKHQRNLGYSMRVERSTKDQVWSRLAALAKQKESSKKQSDFDENLEERETYQELVKTKDEELRRKQEERKRDRNERRKKKKEQQNEDLSKSNFQADDVKEEEPEEEEGMDPNLASMMGFSRFGASSNHRSP